MPQLASDNTPLEVLREQVEKGNLGAATGNRFYRWDARRLASTSSKRQQQLASGASHLSDAESTADVAQNRLRFHVEVLRNSVDGLVRRCFSIFVQTTTCSGLRTMLVQPAISAVDLTSSTTGRNLKCRGSKLPALAVAKGNVKQGRATDDAGQVINSYRFAAFPG